MTCENGWVQVAANNPRASTPYMASITPGVLRWIIQARGRAGFNVRQSG